MTLPRFLQIHTLTSYPAVLLNRDDAGLAKRISYGGCVRTRVSSQCLKRHWRTVEDEWRLQRIPDLTDADFADRSRQHFSRSIAGALVTEGFDENDVVPVVRSLIDRIFKKAPAEGLEDDDVKKLKGKKAKESADASTLATLETRQAFILTKTEVDYLRSIARNILQGDIDLRLAVEEIPKKNSLTKFQKNTRDDLTKNLRALAKDTKVPASIESALFGRMVTSDLLANTDAAIHVAHAFTVHAQEFEIDYFTVVDDLKALDETEDGGSAGIFDTELTSGLFYGYVVVDVPLLVSNLTGVAPGDWAKETIDRALAGKVVEHLLHLVATISPGAKKGSTAPYAYAGTILVEAGARQPRSLASAFEEPVRASRRASLATAAEDALFDRLAGFDRAYGAKEARHFLSLDSAAREGATGPDSLDALAAFARDVIVAAEA
jgi:CRISPR system Cascade subunit CasC